MQHKWKRSCYKKTLINNGVLVWAINRALRVFQGHISLTNSMKNMPVSFQFQKLCLWWVIITRTEWVNFVISISNRFVLSLELLQCSLQRRPGSSRIWLYLSNLILTTQQALESSFHCTHVKALQIYLPREWFITTPIFSKLFLLCHNNWRMLAMGLVPFTYSILYIAIAFCWRWLKWVSWFQSALKWSLRLSKIPYHFF